MTIDFEYYRDYDNGYDNYTLNGFSLNEDSYMFLGAKGNDNMAVPDTVIDWVRGDCEERSYIKINSKVLDCRMAKGKLKRPTLDDHEFKNDVNIMATENIIADYNKLLEE